MNLIKEALIVLTLSPPVGGVKVKRNKRGLAPSGPAPRRLQHASWLYCTRHSGLAASSDNFDFQIQIQPRP
jgi:hypothetical protein